MSVNNSKLQIRTPQEQTIQHLTEAIIIMEKSGLANKNYKKLREIRFTISKIWDLPEVIYLDEKLNS